MFKLATVLQIQLRKFLASGSCVQLLRDVLRLRLRDPGGAPHPLGAAHLRRPPPLLRLRAALR